MELRRGENIQWHDCPDNIKIDLIDRKTDDAFIVFRFEFIGPEPVKRKLSVGKPDETSAKKRRKNNVCASVLLEILILILALGPPEKHRKESRHWTIRDGVASKHCVAK